MPPMHIVRYISKRQDVKVSLIISDNDYRIHICSIRELLQWLLMEPLPFMLIRLLEDTCVLTEYKLGSNLPDLLLADTQTIRNPAGCTYH
jgi:hypothetical protein